MREIFLSFKGAMTKEDLAEVLKVKPDHVRRMAKAGVIPKLPGLRLLRFDPLAMIEVFCRPKAEKATRSLTIERHKTGAKSNGGLRQCL